MSGCLRLLELVATSEPSEIFSRSISSHSALIRAFPLVSGESTVPVLKSVSLGRIGLLRGV
jgi:hypothetical protein